MSKIDISEAAVERIWIEWGDDYRDAVVWDETGAENADTCYVRADLLTEAQASIAALEDANARKVAECINVGKVAEIHRLSANEQFARANAAEAERDALAGQVAALRMNLLEIRDAITKLHAKEEFHDVSLDAWAVISSFCVTYGEDEDPDLSDTDRIAAEHDRKLRAQGMREAAEIVRDRLSLAQTSKLQQAPYREWEEGMSDDSDSVKELNALIHDLSGSISGEVQ